MLMIFAKMFGNTKQLVGIDVEVNVCQNAPSAILVALRTSQSTMSLGAYSARKMRKAINFIPKLAPKY